MADFVYPSNADLQQVAQDKIPRLTADRLGFQVLPMVNVDAAILMWDQLDNFTGLQQVRGLNGQPGRVARTGEKRYLMQPGAYGEFGIIDEIELTARRTPGTFGTPIDISDLVMLQQDLLLGRRLDRIELIIWTLLSTGTFSVTSPNGQVVHTDSYTPQSFNAVADSAAWSNATDSKPLQAFRKTQLLSRGRSVNFGAQAQAVMNRTTFNNLIANTNDADLYGRRTAGLANVLTLGEVNQVLAGEDLPTITIYDEGYLDDNGTFQLFVPNGKVIVIGKRPAGQVVGDYAMTRNANNPDLGPGPYMRVIDRGSEQGGNQVPRTIEVHDGHNGGPRLYFPGAIVIMTVE